MTFNSRLVVIVFVSLIVVIALIINNENFIVEAISIFLTVLIIEWILNGPKRVIYKSAKNVLDSTKYLFYSRLLSAKGFEDEQYEYLTSAIPEIKQSSFEERLAKSTSMLEKLKIEDYVSKFKEYEKADFDGLNHSAKLLLDDLNKFKNYYFLSLGHIGRDSLINCIKSSEMLILNSDIIEETVNGDNRNIFLIGYCAHNIYDIIENLNKLSNQL